MNPRNLKVVLIVTAVALVLPLVVVLAAQNAPLLAVLGVGIAAGVYFSLKAKQPQALAVVPNPIGANFDRGQLPSYSSRTQDVLPKDEAPKKQNWWMWLWNHPNHGMVVLLCGLYILNPLDMVIPIVDDLFAFVLLVKHARDWFRVKWGKPPEQALAENAKDLITGQVLDTASVPSALSPQRLHSRSLN